MHEENAQPATRDRGGDRPANPAVRALLDRYWRKNLTLMAVLLAVWAVGGLGCGVLFAEYLNHFHFFGFPLGFWFAQQGAIILFVLLIGVYCLAMNRLDARHHRDLQRMQKGS